MTRVNHQIGTDHEASLCVLVTPRLWQVDPEGNYIAPVGDRSADAPPSSTGRPGAPLTATQSLYMGMDATQRSMHMWRRLNPGCVPATTLMPISTFNDHFT
jgi:hypothetical protein